MEDETYYSYHIFYFPFEINNTNTNKISDNDSDDNNNCDKKFNNIRRLWKRVLNNTKHNTSKISNKNSDINNNYDKKFNNIHRLWKRTSYNDEQNQIDKDEINLFNVKSYYHTFVHKTIIDEGPSKEQENILEHYERNETLNGQNVLFSVETENNPYILEVKKITLDIFQSRIGIISIYAKNNKNGKPEDICKINSLFRYLYKPNWYENEIKSIKFEGLQKSTDNIERPEKAKESWKLASHIQMLIDDFKKENEKFNNIEISPVFDNKMFVSCCYNNIEILEKLRNAPIEKLSNSIFWQNFIFVDANKENYGIMNKEMRTELTKKASYLRWQNAGTLYGISKQAFVCLTNYNVAVDSMINIYSYLVKIILLQRASLLSLSNEIIKFSTKEEPNYENIKDLYEKYISYIKHLYFKEITPQIQGIELYDIFQETFELKKFLCEYDNEITKIHNYLQTKEEASKKEDQNNFLNFIAAVFLPGSLIAGLFGMNFFEKKPDFLLEFLLICTVTVFIITFFCTSDDYKKTIHDFRKKTKINTKKRFILIMLGILILFIMFVIFRITETDLCNLINKIISIF